MPPARFFKLAIIQCPLSSKMLLTHAPPYSSSKKFHRWWVIKPGWSVLALLVYLVPCVLCSIKSKVLQGYTQFQISICCKFCYLKLRGSQSNCLVKELHQPQAVSLKFWQPITPWNPTWKGSRILVLTNQHSVQILIL